MSLVSTSATTSGCNCWLGIQLVPYRGSCRVSEGSTVWSQPAKTDNPSTTGISSDVLYVAAGCVFWPTNVRPGGDGDISNPYLELEFVSFSIVVDDAIASFCWLIVFFSYSSSSSSCHLEFVSCFLQQLLCVCDPATGRRSNEYGD